jgi:hypothetical protein
MQWRRRETKTREKNEVLDVSLSSFAFLVLFPYLSVCRRLYFNRDRIATNINIRHLPMQQELSFAVSRIWTLHVFCIFAVGCDRPFLVGVSFYSHLLTWIIIDISRSYLANSILSHEPAGPQMKTDIPVFENVYYETIDLLLLCRVQNPSNSCVN